MKSSGLEVFRLSREGEALDMQGPHQWAPTYSPNTVCPGLVASILTNGSSRSSIASQLPEYANEADINDIIRTTPSVAETHGFVVRILSYEAVIGYQWILWLGHLGNLA